MRKLTSAQAQMLGLIQSFQIEHGHSPSIRDLIAASKRIESLRGVTVHLDALERKRYICRGCRQSRAIKVLRNPQGEPVSLAFVLSDPTPS